MSIHLFASASTDILANAIISDLQAEQPGIFQKQWVVTQTDGINKRLRQQMAVQAGMSAQVQFVKMRDILHMLYFALCPGEPRLMDKDTMAWVIYAELASEEFKEKFPGIASYYDRGETFRVALAFEMADLFDQYQIYRHKKIENWNDNKIEDIEGEEWQSYLWRRMKIALGDQFSDHTNLSNKLIAALKKPESPEKVRNILPAIRFFGIAIVTPYYLEIFRQLANIIDVKFYVLNPAPEHLWMDNDSNKKIAAQIKKTYVPDAPMIGNELLVNWGSVLRESYLLILGDDDYVNPYEVISASNEENNTLLSQIQYEIRENISNDERQDIDHLIKTDNSITVNGCYTPAREVEVLYNHLVELFKHDPTLKARDILVMTTDIDQYAPYVHAVFDHAPFKIPYTLSDESVASGNTLFTALKEILLLRTETFTSEEVLSLLDSPYIRKKFGFRNIDDVRQAVREAGIYFGHRELEQDADPATETWMVGWEYGLQKIIYGLCMSGEEVYAIGNNTLYPLDTAEGSDMEDRIRLFTFIQTLKDLLLRRNNGPRTLEGWAEYLGEIIREMVLDEDEDDEDFPRFVNLLETIRSMSEQMQEEIAYLTFRQVFLDKLSLEKRSNYYADKGVNFCSMIPMRSVPYKVIAMLGMDFDKFPRQDSMLSFSLLGKDKRRAGDRSIRENDKHLFLETILAAKDKLYISYIARDVKKGTDQPPSPLVDELLDYIALKTSVPNEFKKEKIGIHPLHVFSTKYNNPDYGFSPNYLLNTLAGKNVFVKKDSAEADSTNNNEIQLQEIINFFKHPVKYFFNKRLQVYYRDEEERLPETEIFELNTLEEWSIKSDFLNEEIELTAYTERQKKQGNIPLANAGNVTLEELKKEMIPYKEKRDKIIESAQERQLTIHYVSQDGFIVNGQLLLYDNKYIAVVNTSSGLKYIMQHWIQYMFALAQQENPLAFYFIYKVDNMPFEFKVDAGSITKQKAIQNVEHYIKIFKEHRTGLFPFYPLFGYMYYKTHYSSPPKKNITQDELFEKQEEARTKDYDSTFMDGGYLDKVTDISDKEAGFFSSQSVQQINHNISMLMDELYDLCPKLFKSKY